MKKAALQLGHVNSYGEALLKDLNDRELELINQKREEITAIFKEEEKDRAAREGNRYVPADCRSVPSTIPCEPSSHAEGRGCDMADRSRIPRVKCDQ